MTNTEKSGVDQRRTNRWGIDLAYEDALGKWHDTPDQTVTAIQRIMGDGGEDGPGPERDGSVLVARVGEQCSIKGRATVILESGETLTYKGRLPADLPPGYHQLQLEGAEKASRLIVSPGKCWLPEDLRTWGWAVQLYAARSRQSWGIGDFADLDQLGQWSAELGAKMMLVNPLSAASPIKPQQGSPYYPTSRQFLNPLWLHVEWAPGATEALPHLEQLARAGRELNTRNLIDRDQVFDLKMKALEVLWRKFAGDAAFDRFCKEHGENLDRFAVFCALAEKHKSGWHSWPQQYRHRDDRAVANFAKENANRLAFHKWLQWLLDGQLARCSKRLALMQDLPIGVDPDGADAWAWQDVLAEGVGVGAPPDEFNTQGQSWGLPPFVPWKLRKAAYEPFIQTIRAAIRNGGGLRIDHVMGLFRLFWIPQGMKAAEGAYVRYDSDELLAIVAIESQRAKAYVVGEDLGTVEKEARESLAKHRILSYRLLWFEKETPESYPREALAAITTHDLPTVAGLWTGSDLEEQRELDLNPNEQSTEEICTRLKSMADLSPDSGMDEVIESAYCLLAKAPSRILTAALDDAVEAEKRPNMPATMEDKRPNWSIALPVPIEELMIAKLPKTIAAALRRDKRAAS